MITFGRGDGDEVLVNVKTGYHAGNSTILTAFSAGSKWARDLLYWHIMDKMHDTLSKIREDAYESGWSDAKKHKAKAKWFSGSWE